MDDSYLRVRVSSLRHHNYGFQLSTRNSIFDLASATYAVLEPVGRSKVSLRFALDLALKTSSPLSRNIANSILDLCHNVQQMYSARHAREWFLKAITRACKTRTWNRRAQLDAPASDCSVEARPPRYRENPTSCCCCCFSHINRSATNLAVVIR